jgi:hypothetical protein
MKYYLCFISLFLLNFSNHYSSNKNDSNAIVDTLKKSFSANDSIKNYTTIKIDTVIDTITKFIKDNLYSSSIINLSFCQKELVRLLDKNDSCKTEWKKKIMHLRTMYDTPIDTVSMGVEINFFRNNLLKSKQLRNEYSDGYDFLIKSLPTDFASSLSDVRYQSLMLRFKNAGGGNFSELSGVYYAFLITDGLKFTNAISENKNCVIQFRKWIKNIEDTEFVAYGSDNVPPAIIERKRNYVINEYSFKSNSLMKEAIGRIKVAKIRSID